MDAFTVLTGVAAPLPMVNVDTDKIIPAPYLRTIHRTGLAKGLFHELRYQHDGTENPDFVLNREPYRHARILVSGENFGCGSSREHAPWALLDFGIRCIIAPSFADIFFGNCFKNGVLPLILPQAEVDKLMADAEDPYLCTPTIDLQQQVVIRVGGEHIAFQVDAFRRHMLLNGLDEIGLTLTHDADIASFEARQRAEQPWLWARG